MRATDDKVTGSERAEEEMESNTPRSRGTVKLHLLMLHAHEHPHNLIYMHIYRFPVEFFYELLPVLSSCQWFHTVPLLQTARE